MARYPGGRWRPVTRYQPGVAGSIATRMTTPRRLILHTAVSANTSLHSWFNVPGRATSHFYIDHAGNVEQYIDTDYRSTANLEGNHDSITVETQDIGGPFPSWNTNTGNVPAWTAAQVEALARLAAWCNEVHGIPLQLLPSSQPGTRGVGWHRIGINGNFPTTGLLRGRQQRGGGELWSSAAGKVCPGDRRINQIPGIVDRAKQITAPGGSTPPPSSGGMTMDLSDRSIDFVNSSPTTARHQIARSHEYNWLQVRRRHGKPRFTDETDQTLPWFTRQGYSHAREGRDAAREGRDEAIRNGQKLDALLDAQLGQGSAEIKAHIDARHAELLGAHTATHAALVAASDRIEALEQAALDQLVILQEALAGERDAMDALRALHGILGAHFVGGDPDELDT